MNITHSLRKDGLYDLKRGGTVLTQVRKDADGFRILNRQGQAGIEAMTMADAKMWVDHICPDETVYIGLRDPRAKYTVEGARKMTALSNNGVRSYLAAAHYSKVPRHLLGFAVLQLRIQLLAEVKSSGTDFARTWLEQNQHQLIENLDFPPDDLR